MVQIFFDNNALNMLFSYPERDRVVKNIQCIQDAGAMQTHFNFCNFCERLLGIQPDSYTKVQEFLRLSLEISRGHILLRPVVHLRQVSNSPIWFHSLTSQEIENEARQWTTLMRKLLDCKEFEEAYACAEPLKSMIEYDKTSRLNLANEVTAHMCSARLAARSRGKEAVIAADKDECKAWLYKSKIRDFGLIRDGYDVNGAQIVESVEALPSVEYFVDVVLSYYSQLLSGCRQPRASDPIDFEQLLYLDRMDYFITNDKNLRRLASSCGNKELEGRLITVDEFKKACDSEVLYMPKRAPLVNVGIIHFEN